ncbi:uncharacterized protein LOC127661496 [Xyrauchen texanus]|uniref:uncharacterized protein LOC127661496 n=1 Tax=Xyrauchen texanus TaxID=154827 RepID=UPI0022420FDF|nr:uncharacterized protein LOC127661496 [Xyrauchen texanus]
MTIQIPVHHMLYLKILMNHPYFILCLWQNILLKRRDKHLQGLTTRRPNDPTKSELKETLEVLLRKVDSLAATQREILILLRKRQGHQRAEDILELNIAQNKEELEDLDHRLKDLDFRKRVPYWWVKSRGLCEESDAGSSDKHRVEPIQFEGKREKLPLIDTTLCKVIKHAVMKCKSDLGEKDVECYIAETLKHVPAQLKKHVQDRLPVGPAELE